MRPQHRTSAHIACEVQQSIGIVTLTRAEARNAFTQQTYAAFSDAMELLDSDARVHVILIRAEGRDFCAGNDLAEFTEREFWSPDALEDPAQTPSTRAVHVLMDCKKPVVAAVQGRAVGFGATLLLHCDAVVASDTASLIYPFVQLGIVPEAGSTQLLAERLGYLRAMDVLTRPGAIRSAEAVALGLVSEIVADDELQTHARQKAQALAGLPQQALQQTKSLLKRKHDGLHERVGLEFRKLAECLNSKQSRDILTALRADKK